MTRQLRFGEPWIARSQDLAHELRLAPVALELLCLSFLLAPRREPGELRVPDEAGRGVEEHEGRGTLWIRRCEEDAQRAGVTEAKDHGSLGLGGVHDGANVVHSTLERGHTRDAIGHAHSAQVEQDETRGRSESAIELCDGEALPVELEVGYRRSEDQVRWTIA